jgi:hypothetical protein
MHTFYYGIDYYSVDHVPYDAADDKIIPFPLPLGDNLVFEVDFSLEEGYIKEMKLVYAYVDGIPLGEHIEAAAYDYFMDEIRVAIYDVNPKE